MPKNKTRNKGFKNTFKPKQLVATFMYNKDRAKSFHKREYYQSQSDYKRSIVEIDKIKKQMATSKQEMVTAIFDKYVEKAKTKEVKIFKVITRIRDKVIYHIDQKLPPPVHDDIMSLISNRYILLQAYNKTRTNKGTMTAAYPIPEKDFAQLDDDQKKLITKLYYGSAINRATGWTIMGNNR